MLIILELITGVSVGIEYIELDDGGPPNNLIIELFIARLILSW